MKACRMFLLIVLVWFARAERADAQIYLTPWIGAFSSQVGGDDLPVVHESGLVQARMTGSPAIGVTVQGDLPIRFLSLRVGVGTALFSAMEFLNWDGTLSEGTYHQSFGNPAGFPTIINFLTVSAVVTPWSGDVQPYLMGGIGIKRHHHSDLSFLNRSVFSGPTTSASFQAGLGFSMGPRFRIEISDHISIQSLSFEIPQMTLHDRERVQHDFLFSLGYRLGPL